MSEVIACVATELFNECGHLQGFTTDVEKYKLLLDPLNIMWLPRDEIEEDPRYKQLIPYVLLAKQLDHGKIYLSYFRGDGQDEARLHAKRSIGIGGHVNLKDESEDDPFHCGMMREVTEEITLTRTQGIAEEEDRPDTSLLGIELLGVVNDDTNEVGRVHLGMVHIMMVTGFLVDPAEADICDLHWLSPEELTKNREDYETWSQLTIDHLGQDR
jgi:predicted NUDIX family phosphoesterase